MNRRKLNEMGPKKMNNFLKIGSHCQFCSILCNTKKKQREHRKYDVTNQEVKNGSEK